MSEASSHDESPSDHEPLTCDKCSRTDVDQEEACQGDCSWCDAPYTYCRGPFHSSSSDDNCAYLADNGYWWDGILCKSCLKAANDALCAGGCHTQKSDFIDMARAEIISDKTINGLRRKIETLEKENEALKKDNQVLRNLLECT